MVLVPTSAQSSAEARACCRARTRRRAAAGHPAAARAFVRLDHERLPARARRRGDHRHDPRAASADDARQRRPRTLMRGPSADRVRGGPRGSSPAGARLRAAPLRECGQRPRPRACGRCCSGARTRSARSRTAAQPTKSSSDPRLELPTADCPTSRSESGLGVRSLMSGAPPVVRNAQHPRLRHARLQPERERSRTRRRPPSGKDQSVSPAQMRELLSISQPTVTSPLLLSARKRAAPAAFRLRLVAVAIVDLARELADRIGFLCRGLALAMPLGDPDARPASRLISR
jgi:hypothetical protein